MRNYVQHGDIVDLTAPQPIGVVSGEGFFVGDLFGVASTDAKPGQKVSTWLEGVFQLPKASGTGLTEGQKVYWDVEEKKVTADETDNAFIGYAVESVLAAAAFVPVRLAR